ncbi:DUF1015 domain-containing protein [candidate division FCPU426 bacterium]|nr:DUF1015 domain-containing protein [candidate division FCPU426 bacterium]
MAKIAPFAGLRYTKTYASIFGRLVTPPYDIISPQEQKRFYQAHPHNIIRLEYGLTKTSDSEQNNRYIRARKTLAQWLQAGVLAVEPKASLYLMQTEYKDAQNRAKCFTGLLARVKLEAFGEGKIMPHEKTYEGPKADRFNLLKETGVSFSPVLSLYRDPAKRIQKLLHKQQKKTAAVQLKDWSGARHRLWVIHLPAVIQDLQDAFQGKKLLIADGHHRYLTAIKYQKEHGAQAGPDADWVMMCLAEIHDPGLSVLPVCRLCKGLSQKQWGFFKSHCENYFEVEKVHSSQILPAAQTAAAKKVRSALIGYIEQGGKQAYLLKVKDGCLDMLFPPGRTNHSRIYHRLDVVILNQIILQQLLGIQPGEEKGRVWYTKNPEEARLLVARGEAQAAFLPGLPNMDAIWDLAKQGETMPQKSTYFLPKLITGLVMNPVALTKWEGKG